MPGDESIAAGTQGALAPPEKLNVPTALLSADNTAGTTSADALAEILRNNEDYMVVYWAVEALKSQLSRAKSDMAMLVSLRQQALANPFEYVEALVEKSAPQAPPLQAVVDVPSVYLEPYLSCADAASIEQYMAVVHSKMSAESGGKIDATGLAGKLSTAVILSKPIQYMPLVSGKSARRSARQLSSGNFGMLTGNTVVTTPDHSPGRDLTRPTSLSNGSTTLTAVTTSLFDQMLAANSHLPESRAAPVASRANTEPIHCVSDTGAADNSALISQINAAGGIGTTIGGSKTSVRTSMTQPGTPASRGQSQKTLTPQMLESFRRQLTDEHVQAPRSDLPLANSVGEYDDSDDDDDYYNALVQSATAEYASGKPDSNGMSGNLSSVPPAGFQVSGKAMAPGNRRTCVQVAPLLQGKGRGPRAAASEPKPKGVKRRYNYSDNQDKPPSFNMPWTDEEQARLEELLVVFPDEEVSNNRWRKISSALGTRTVRQVSSRVQKYFIKLKKAGLPVPGRAPDTSNWMSMSRSRAETPSRVSTPKNKRRQNAGGATAGSRNKRKYVDFTSSSGEDDDDYGAVGMSSDLDDAGGFVLPYDRKGKQADRSGDFAFDGNLDYGHQPTSARNGGSGEMFMLSASRAGPSSASQQQHQPLALRGAKAVHLGYRCDSCLADPIVGIRWHCTECRGAQAVDLCDECREEGLFETESHHVTHSFHAMREAEMEPYYANEVAATALREYSYLA